MKTPFPLTCWTVIVLLHCGLALLQGAVPPGSGRFYSDHGRFDNSCPIDNCRLDCNVGFYRSGCAGNSSGTCVPCDNPKPDNSEYTTRGGLTSTCEWGCSSGFARQGGNCVSNVACSKLGGIPTNSVYSNTNFPNCDHQCRAGFFNAQASTNPTSCSICAAGTFSSQGATACTDCGVGTFSNLQGSSSISNCQGCAAGKYSTTVRATAESACTSCLEGTYSTATGASSVSACQGCAEGTASNNVGASNAATCVACGTGKFTNTKGSTSCSNCAAGTFMNVTGATKCFNCDPNTYAATTGMSACLLCDYCSRGNFRSGCGPISAGFCSACSNPAVSS